MKKVSDVKMSKMTMLSAIAAIAIAVFISGAGALEAQAREVIITGGGVVQNNNASPAELLSIGGFVAKSTGEAGLGGLLANGQLEAKTTPASGPNKALLAIHGEVVCIVNLGQACGAGGDDNDVWEIRFMVTKSSNTDQLPEGAFGSLFVQDNGTPGVFDFGDESFAAAGPNCAQDVECALEPLLKGNFTVHEAN